MSFFFVGGILECSPYYWLCNDLSFLSNLVTNILWILCDACLQSSARDTHTDKEAAAPLKRRRSQMRDKATTNNYDDRQYTTIKQNTVEVGGRQRQWWWCWWPNDPLGNESVPRYFRGTFHSCMGTIPMLFTWQGLLVWTQQETTITLDNRYVLLAGHGSLNGPLTLRIMSQYFAYIFKPCMRTMLVCFMPHMHL